MLRVNSEELIGNTECMPLDTGFLINRCRYNRVRLCVFNSVLCSCFIVNILLYTFKIVNAKQASINHAYTKWKILTTNSAVRVTLHSVRIFPFVLICPLLMAAYRDRADLQ